MAEATLFVTATPIDESPHVDWVGSARCRRSGGRSQPPRGRGLHPHDVRLMDRRWLIKTSSGKLASTAIREKYLREQAGP
jgi:hypothetical protein